MKAALLAAALIVVFLLWSEWRVAALDAQVQTLEEFIMDKLTATWRSGTTTHVVETVQRDGETDDAHEARHAARVARMQVIYPPNQQ